jgi:hypothetical protein
MADLSIITEPNSIHPEKIFNLLKQFFAKKNINIDINNSIDTLEFYISKYLGVKMSESLKNKLRAYKALLTSNLIFEQWHVFHSIANFIVDGLGDTESLEPIEDIELIVTLDLLKKLRPNKQFNEEVKSYIRQMWTKQFGIIISHPLLAYYGIELPGSIERTQIENKYEKIQNRPDIVDVLNRGGFSELEEIQLKKIYILDKALKQFNNFSIESTWL